ncbi:MAG: ATP-dependent DNA helicase PcrA [Candidatus Pacebacteria bacterium CG10_big_fil_rev_8_21_14_0_10_36_11]|nr:MAG: ATP-dependent DNA helicase PcrA [Candidatus Pacebacteria bacterium CG10_big_fil_rev_8_21_14_0_10_36_11]PJC42580.1 MAG: ATP-dependent DNA helicase PcrA [Candidatus Pacebacteria bacterium CG_4_9_14_0_2_um_filter_36_8]
MTNMPYSLDQLNEQQRAAVLHPEGPAIVLAGAGSGKTKVLTTRVAYLIAEKKVNPDSILLVTFTNKAAGEMNKRVFELTGRQLRFSGTFHSLCTKILRIHADKTNRSHDFTIYDSNDQLSLIKHIYKDRSFDPKKYTPQFVKSLISQAKNEMLVPEEYKALAHDDAQEFAAKVYQIYQYKLRELNAFDFDDLLLETVNLLQNDKEILGYYQDQVEHVLVDEYQDTNKAQYFLTKFFAHPHDNLYVVGDFSQSIYAWRGADYRNLMRLGQDFEKIKEYKLEQNYRSTQTILDAATQVISQNTSHPVLGLWTENTQSEPITVIENADETTEAMKVAQCIRQQVGYSYQDFAILYRTNAQSRAFEEVFVKEKIPYRIVGGVRFYDRKEIKDLISYLRLLLNPQDLVSMERAQKNGKRRLNKLLQWQTTEEEKIKTLSPLELLESVIKKTEYLSTFDEKDPQDSARIENIQELLNTAAQFEDTTVFLENVALVQDGFFHDVDGSNAKPGVTLMSLHSAKGLEFPVVFLVGMEEGLLPHQQSLWDKEELEEERRLCYVGITRAKEKLFCTYAQRRWNFGKITHSTRSRFLSDIKKHLLEEIGVSHPNGNVKVGYTATYTGRKIIDDDTLDALLDGEMNIKEFLDS